MIMDDSISSNTEHDLYEILSDHHPRTTSLSMMRVKNSNQIKSMLSGLNLYQMGGKFLIMVRKNIAGNFVKAVSKRQKCIKLLIYFLMFLRLLT